MNSINFGSYLLAILNILLAAFDFTTYQEGGGVGFFIVGCTCLLGAYVCVRQISRTF